MKFFITNPVGYYGEKHILPPIGPLYIATIAKQKGCEVIYQDAYLEDPSQDDFKTRLLQTKPDIIGISSNAEDRLAGINTAKIAKETLPESLVIMGGPFPTMVHKEIIKELDFVDIVVRHEGEITIAEIIEAVKNNSSFKNIKGITYRQNNEIIINKNAELIKDLNDLPMPDYEMTKINQYKSYLPTDKAFDNLETIEFVKQSRSNRPMANLIFARGCPYNCTFCSADAMWHRTLRNISPENAIRHVKYYIDRGIYDFVFQDDHLIADKKWFFELANGLKNLDKKIRYACLARIDALDDETAKLIYESGGRMITLGIENLSNHTLKLMNKKITVEQTWKALEILHNNKIIVRGGVLIESPGETLDDLTENIKQHHKLRKYLIQAGGLTPLRIYPGSPLEQVAKEQGQLNFSWVKNYNNSRNYLLSAPVHIPIYENIPHEKVLPHVIKESLKNKDHYLSRVLIRQHIVRIGDPGKRSFMNKFKERYLAILGVVQYLLGSPIKILQNIKFLLRVLTVKESKI
ncbi:B12-binding domain-containing radical SAM protein [Patescibacteria group bacterium]|nr:B12-binding domain-containing radical SAM protein [Patescibacteria group bacterium]